MPVVYYGIGFAHEHPKSWWIINSGDSRTSVIIDGTAVLKLSVVSMCFRLYVQQVTFVLPAVSGRGREIFRKSHQEEEKSACNSIIYATA